MIFLYNYADFNENYLKTQAERKKVRSAANTVGFSFVAAEAAMTILSIVLSLAVRFLFKGSADILKDSILLKYLNTLLLLVGFVLIPAVTCLIAGTKPRKVISLRRVDPLLFLGAVLLAFGFNSVCNVVSSYLSALFSFLKSDSTTLSEITEVNGGVLGFILSVINVALVPAFFEEFAFRGIALGLFRRSTSDGVAIILSALMFGMIHGKIEQIPFAFCMGVVFAYITVITDSLFPAMAAHFLNNFSSLVLGSVSDGAGPATQTIIYAIDFIIVSALAVIGFVILADKMKEKRNLSGDFAVPVSTHIKWGVLSPGIIVFLVFIIIRMILGA